MLRYLFWTLDDDVLLVLLCADTDVVTSDVLGMMMVARDQCMSDEELRDQVKTVMFAGHEVCTISSLSV